MKKKIFVVTLVVCLLALTIASSSLAYFTDTDAKSNVFTVGNVNIDLLHVEKAIDTNKLYPNSTYDNPASIDNVGTEDAYVGAIINIDFASGVTKPAFDTLKVIFTGLEAATNTVKYVETATGYAVYVVVNAALTASAEPATIFSSIAIPALWGNDEMAPLNGMKISVTAYATQTVGFTNGALDALKTAFALTAWDNCPTN